MIDLGEVNREINRLENAQTTYGNCEKLSVLYSVRNNMGKPDDIPEPRLSYSYSNGSEFAQAFMSAEPDVALRIMDEHMETIKVLYPKEYSAIIRRLNS